VVSLNLAHPVYHAKRYDEVYSPYRQNTIYIDRQTNGQTDGQTDTIRALAG